MSRRGSSRCRLQSRMAPRLARRHWVNWSRGVSARPREWHEPASEDEIAALVRGARGRRLRVAGAGPSWSATAAPEDIALSLARWTGVVALAPGQVTARAGTRLADLDRSLAAAGLALPIVGSIAEQTLG